MPTILRIDGFEIVIYLLDHAPAHVHVFAGGSEVILHLNCTTGEPEISQFYRFKKRELRAALTLVTVHQENCVRCGR